MDTMTLAQVMYEAYGEKAEWKAFGGTPMPTWAQLQENSPQIVERWVAAAEAAQTAIAASVAV